MKILSLIFLILAIFVLFLQIDSQMPQPVAITQDERLEQIESIVKKYNKNKANEIAQAIIHAHRITNICPFLLLSLAITESGLKPGAISPKGYGSYMQTDKWSGNTNVDFLYGAEKLKYFLLVTNYDFYKAVALYKGGWKLSGEAKQQAKEVLALYQTIIEGGGKL